MSRPNQIPVRPQTLVAVRDVTLLGSRPNGG